MSHSGKISVASIGKLQSPLFGALGANKNNSSSYGTTTRPDGTYDADIGFKRKLPDKNNDSSSASGSYASGSGSDSDSDSSDSKSSKSKKSSEVEKNKSDSDQKLDSDESRSEKSSGSGKDSSSRSSSDDKDNDVNHHSSSKAPHLYDTDSQETQDSFKPKHGRSKQLKEEFESKGKKKFLWDQQPDLYGIRRSARARKEPTRYNAGEEEGSDSDGKPKRRSRKKDSTDWDGSASSSGSEDNYKPAYSKVAPRSRSTRQTKKPNRGGRRPAAKLKGRRRNLSSSSSESDSEDERRYVAKRSSARKTVSYKEETEDGTDSDDIVEVSQDKVEEVEDNRNAIEKVLDTRTARKGDRSVTLNGQSAQTNGQDAEGEKPEMETQYLIKWKNWAHIHNTWESDESIGAEKVNGMKKLDNFKKKMAEINEWKDNASPEDLEYFECQEEMVMDLYKQYRNVERIIAHSDQKMSNENNGYPDYLCKWSGLPYSDCTWEDGELISRSYQSYIDEYLARNKSQRIPTKLCKVLKVRPKFTPLKNQPLYLGGSDHLELRDYQLEGLNWMINAWTKENCVILADEMGLGKTIQIISFLSVMMNQYQLYGPFLMVVPLSTVVAWQREFSIWAPEINVVIYMGDITSRNLIRDYEWCHPGNKRLKFNVLLTTYELLLKDKSFLGSVNWAFLGVDEAHRLKNDDSMLYKILFDFHTNHRILITGTPLQNSLKELWSLLHFIMPEKFNKWADFEIRHSKADKTGFAALHKELEPFLIRRIKKDVEKSLPSKVEQILRVEMSTIQKQYYRWILTKNYKALSKGLKGNVSSFVNIIMELKKCCNHAQLTRPPEEEPKDYIQGLIKGSGKLILLDKLLRRLQDTGHRVLIFSQMVRMLDILAEYLSARHIHFQRLDGSIRGELRKQALDHFNAENSQDFCFLLSTRAGGLGVNLATADTVIIFDSDWNPQNDIQAQARAHRIGQKKQVSVYRLITKNSVEEEIVERAKKKMVLDHLVIQRMDTTGRTVLDRGNVPSSNSTPFNKEELASILKFGAADLFKETDDDEEEPQVDIDDILNRAETHETEATTAGDELLSQFKVVSFDNLEEDDIETPKSDPSPGGQVWDNIIPEDIRRKVDEEERQQQLLELHLPPRSRKTIQQLQLDYDSESQRKKKKKKHDADDSEVSDEDTDDGKPKRRGRPRAGKDAIKGFTDAEIRRFVRSYKKFGAPLSRLDSIACDSELQEKSEADLQRLGNLLHQQCVDSVIEHKAKMAEDPSADGKKYNRGPSFKLAGVVVNVNSVLKAEHDLQPLADTIPANKEERKKFQLTCRLKAVHWDCPWEVEDDSNLLKGVYEYGMGSWEAIKMDPELELHEKILPHGMHKPQCKHLQTRVEYVLKALRQTETKNEPKPRKERKERKSKPKESAKFKSKAEIEEDDSSSDDEHSKNDNKNSVVDGGKRHSKDSDNDVRKNDHDHNDSGESDPHRARDEKKRDKKQDKKKDKKNKDQAGPMHFTASSEPISISQESEDAELTPEIFAQCKDEMRPVKRALNQLDHPEDGLTEKEQIMHMRRCLLKVGDHIHEYLGKMTDPDLIKKWRNFLWMFVARFTELDHIKLHKLYKHAVKKRGDVEERSQGHTEHSRDSQVSKRSHGKSERLHKDQPPSKKHQSDHDKDHNRSRDGSASNGPKHHSSSHPSAHSSLHRTPVGAVKEAAKMDSCSSPGDMWTHVSPLARAEEPQRDRHYNQGSSKPFKRYSNDSRHGNSSQHKSHTDSYHRFNNDRHAGGQPYAGSGSYGRGGDERHSSYYSDSHRSSHNYPEYGHHYRDESRDSRDNRYSSGGRPGDDFPRKRKSEDSMARPSGSHKDPRLQHSRQSSFSRDHEPDNPPHV
ncbi:chromodomain-helicase-DNA-binding protein 1-like isoform X2 [Gigantopelta aegis]|uniref:chromodomain-helicase-DNA-binding protein 1-like isoform X2 n=1 Tax=Gigantopelta aegis TaxID=1735272 RepID=UPI001B88CFEA|nr:chromodomain-helicase-DNA-binding protein 1-like isoform X2 [Gigantopelta aegis]